MKKVTLFGGSGTMGFETFKVLWERCPDCRITLLLRPSARNVRMFKPYLDRNRSVRIIWGDATVYGDVRKAVAGSDYVLDAMALISPQADYYPDKARSVNVDGIANIVKAIGEEPDGNDRIKLAYTGTVAETGDRLPPIHWGRTGDPLKPSIFDNYAVTKIAGERLVLESDIKHWVSLRMTFIMPMTFRALTALSDPIMFHMPLNSCMENISSRDAGFGMANVVNIPGSSSFWGCVYNMSGGPMMRTTARDYLDRTARMFGGTGIQDVSENGWFARHNFHMQFFADSWKLNEYLGHWRDSLDDWERIVRNNLPSGLKLVRKLASINRKVAEGVNRKLRETYALLATVHKNGTVFWQEHENKKRLDAFFGLDRDRTIPDWKLPETPVSFSEKSPPLLNHGYDESKASLDLSDLKAAAEYRGGRVVSGGWKGNLFSPVQWECAFGHIFTAKPNTVLKGGHWCPDCEAPDWNFAEIALRNPFFNQVIAPFADLLPLYKISEKDLGDIAAG